MDDFILAIQEHNILIASKLYCRVNIVCDFSTLDKDFFSSIWLLFLRDNSLYLLTPCVINHVLNNHFWGVPNTSGVWPSLLCPFNQNNRVTMTLWDKNHTFPKLWKLKCNWVSLNSNFKRRIKLTTIWTSAGCYLCQSKLQKKLQSLQNNKNWIKNFTVGS